jgi:hypothetical protein
MPKISKTAFIILVFFLSFVLVILNFRFLYLAGGDQGTFIHVKMIFPYISTFWDEGYNFILGGENMFSILLMPLVLFFKILSFLPAVAVEYLYFSFILGGIFLASYYYFYYCLFKSIPASIIATLAYLFNVFFFVSYVNFNIHTTFLVLPLLYVLCHQIIDKNIKKILLIILLISLLLPASFSNLPAVVPLVPATFIYLVYLLIKNRISIVNISIVKTVFFTLLAFLVLNIWWMYPFLHSYLTNQALQILGSIDYNMFRTTALNRAIRFNGGWAFNSQYLGSNHGRYDDYYYNNAVFIICNFIPIICGFLSLIYSKKNRDIIFFFFLSLISLTLVKGDLNPFGKLYYLAWTQIPGFFMFREPYTKFSLYYVFSVSVLLGYFVLHFPYFKSDSYKKIVYLIILAAILIPGIPFIIGAWVPATTHAGPIRSYLAKIPEYTLEFEKYNEKQLLDYRIFSYPGNTQSYLWESGLNIENTVLKFFSSKPTLSNSSGMGLYSPDGMKIINKLYDLADGSDDNFVKMLSVFNVGAIVLENDKDWRWLEGMKSPSQTEEMISKYVSLGQTTKTADFGFFNHQRLTNIHNVAPNQYPHGNPLSEEQKINLEQTLYQELINRPALAYYRVDNQYFLPHLLIPTDTIITNTEPSNILQIIKKPDYNIRSAVYFLRQIENSSVLSLINQKEEDSPVIEYKKINPTKYRVKIHQAKNNFPFVFQTAFHEGWKINIKKIQNYKNVLDNYKIIEGNEGDQATNDELTEYINKGWVTELKNNHIEFVSKNFQGTIQNENMDGGVFYETWLFNKNHYLLPERNHLMVNGYANSWIIETEKLCQNNDLCLKNTDSTYEMEFVLEFSPQRNFVLFILVSFIGFIFCLVFFGKKYLYANKK